MNRWRFASIYGIAESIIEEGRAENYELQATVIKILHSWYQYQLGLNRIQALFTFTLNVH